MLPPETVVKQNTIILTRALKQWILYNYPPKGRWIVVPMYRDTKWHRGTYLVLFIDPEGGSCFSIYQVSWRKMKKVTFCKLKMSLCRNFVYNLQWWIILIMVLCDISYWFDYITLNKNMCKLLLTFVLILLYCLQHAT